MGGKLLKTNRRKGNIYVGLFRGGEETLTKTLGSKTKKILINLPSIKGQSLT